VLKKQILNFIENKQKLELFSLEKEYIEKHHLLNSGEEMVELGDEFRFSDAYIERGSKESEEMIAKEDVHFLSEKVDYLKRHMNEFIYLESRWFELIGVDAVSFEVDDLFRTYDVMVGLKLQKKWESLMRTALNSLLGDDDKFDLMFSNEDGLWDLNFDLDAVEGFSESMTLNEAYQLIYQFLFHLVEQIEETKKQS
jgi:hypothetical protein